MAAAHPQQSLHWQGWPGAASTRSATINLPPLGLDLAKLKFNACLVRADGKLRHRVFANDEAGFSQLSEWLTRNGAPRVHACLEAIGAYSDSLATYLHDAGHTVSVLNPAAIKAYAQSRLSRTKTDRVDASLIAGFCAERRPPAWHPPAPEIRELQALVRRLGALVEMRVVEVNRLSSGGTVAAVRASVEEHIAYLAEQIERTQALIRDHIDRHPGLRRQSELLDSIPGIGEATAAVLLAEITDIKQYRSARQVAARGGPFFSASHRPARHAAIAASSRWAARSPGFCGVQASALSRR